MNLRTFSALLLCMVGLWCVSGSVQAKETDQFTDRLAVLRYYAGGYRKIRGAPGPEEVDRVLDARMNELLDRLLVRVRQTRDDSAQAHDQLIREVFQHRFLPELVTPYEEWVDNEAPLPLYRVRDKGIYGNLVDFDDMRIAWYIDLSPTLEVAGVLIGSDKIGHFIAQGYEYYLHYRQLDPALPVAARCAMVRERGQRQEVGQLGLATGGVFSFADLASNWAGMTFFLALFDDVEIEGQRHARYLVRDPRGVYQRARDFHWAEYVTSDWDEVLNPNGVERRELYEKLTDNFWRNARDDSRQKSVCDHYLENPDAYLGPRHALRPRSSYAPSNSARVAPYSVDVRVICRTRPAR